MSSTSDFQNSSNTVILLSSVLLTIKSVYRLRNASNITTVYLSFDETNKKLRFQIPIKKEKDFNFLFKGNTVTVHSSGNDYLLIQEGNHMPEKNHIYVIK